MSCRKPTVIKIYNVMQKFVVYNPTKLHFGNGVIEDLNVSLPAYGNKALLLIGQGSVKKHGHYDKVIEQIKKANIQYILFEGIKPNPVIEDAQAAIEVCNKEQIDFIIALGGGSVVDTAKIVSLAYASGVDPWKMVTYQEEALFKVPVIAIMTVAATGTEMNPYAVIQNPKTLKKLGYFNPLAYPDESFLDPTFTVTVPRDHTAYGIVDLIAHALEAYFAKGDDATLNDRFVAAVINEAMEYGPQLIEDLQNLQLREKIMWAATNALNGLLFFGRQTNGDWGTHNFAHNLSLIYDTPHGASLSIVFPAWMRNFKDKLSDRIVNLGKLLYNQILEPDEVINKLEDFFKSIGSPVKVKELGITGEDEKQRFLEQIYNDSPQGFNIVMTRDDYRRIVDMIWE